MLKTCTHTYFLFSSDDLCYCFYPEFFLLMMKSLNDLSTSICMKGELSHQDLQDTSKDHNIYIKLLKFIGSIFIFTTPLNSLVAFNTVLQMFYASLIKALGLCYFKLIFQDISISLNEREEMKGGRILSTDQLHFKPAYIMSYSPSLWNGNLLDIVLQYACSKGTIYFFHISALCTNKIKS